MNREQIVAVMGEDTVSRDEALIGKAFGEFTRDDVQRCIDSAAAQIEDAQADIDIAQRRMR
jgi:hypothetical protein